MARLASTVGGGLRAAEASLEGIRIQASLAGKLHHLVVGVGGRDQVLIVIDQVVELPEGLGVLLVGATAGESGSAGPGMEGVNGKVLEDDLDLGIVGEEAADSVVKTAADGAFEVSKFHDGDGRFGIAEDRGVLEIELGDDFRQAGHW